jgi:putative drug exporter of the RND superfamily
VRSVAAIGRWSARRPWRAIVLWLAFVALCLAAAVATGTESFRNGAVGESARAYATLDAHPGAWPPAREYAYLHSDPLRAADPRFRDAVGAASAALATGIGGGVRTER